MNRTAICLLPRTRKEAMRLISEFLACQQPSTFRFMVHCLSCLPTFELSSLNRSRCFHIMALITCSESMEHFVLLWENNVHFKPHACYLLAKLVLLLYTKSPS
jgi:hypothetical protein